MQQFEDNMWLEHTPATPAFENFKSEQPPSGALDAWKSGMTGYPFLDACMRSLTHTGWINFRMRAMMVSFASYHLWLPWRDIGVHMARMFTDYEPAIHWPLIQMQSGANLYNLPRIYNISKQALDHDPDGMFTRQWCPELKDVPTALLQTPWEWNKAPSTLDGVYPKPFPGTMERGALSKDIAFQIHNSLNPQKRTGTPKPPPAQLSLDI
jgi:deoxyribodipyrimidine photo-lyase